MTSEHSRIAKFVDDSYNLKRWSDLPNALLAPASTKGHSKVTCMQNYAGTTIDEPCIWRKCRWAWEINQQSLLTFLLSIYLLGTYFAHIGHVILALGFILFNPAKEGSPFVVYIFQIDDKSKKYVTSTFGLRISDACGKLLIKFSRIRVELLLSESSHHFIPRHDCGAERFTTARTPQCGSNQISMLYK